MSRRKVIHEASTIISKAFDVEQEIDDFLDDTEQRILGVSDDRISSSFARVGDIVQESIKVVERMYDQKQPITGVPSAGYRDLDR